LYKYIDAAQTAADRRPDQRKKSAGRRFCAGRLHAALKEYSANFKAGKCSY